MAVNQPAFRPEPSKTVSLTASSSSGNVLVQPAGVNSRHVRIVNAGSVTVFIREGQDNTLTASPTVDFPLLAGAVEVISSRSAYFAAVTASGTATVYFTPGEGL